MKEKIVSLPAAVTAFFFFLSFFLLYDIVIVFYFTRSPFSASSSNKLVSIIYFHRLEITHNTYKISRKTLRSTACFGSGFQGGTRTWMEGRVIKVRVRMRVAHGEKGRGSSCVPLRVDTDRLLYFSVCFLVLELVFCVCGCVVWETARRISVANWEEIGRDQRPNSK